MREHIGPGRVADWLSLAATPAFALMALLTAAHGASSISLLCGKGNGFLGGMVPMYVMMSAFHAAPWLRLIDGWRSTDL